MVSNSKIINQISSIKRKNPAKITKFKILVKSKNHDFLFNFRNIEAEPSFLTLEAKLTFTKLTQIFIKALILYYFN